MARPRQPQAAPASAAASPDLQAEENVLGAIMIAPRLAETLAELVSPADFFRASHGVIFEVAVAMNAADRPVDVVTLADELDRRGALVDAGGRSRLAELGALVPAAGNAPHYARIVREHATRRGVLRVALELQRLTGEHAGSGGSLLEEAERLVFELSQARVAHDFVPVAESLAESYRRVEAAYEKGEDVTGLPTGFKDLDALTSGFQPGNLIILAARPSLGKSSLALGVVSHVAVHRRLPVALFTLEMSRYEINQRLVSGEASVDLRRVRNGRLRPEEWQRVQRAFAAVEPAPLYVDDAAAATVLEVRSRARRLKLRQPGLALVVVDYLQLMTSGAGRDGGGLENRVQDVSAISRGLKVLAGELEVPVLALSQLSRSPESRHDKRPLLSDLRESGALEQDADVVMFIYRDEVYHPEDTVVEGIAEVNVAKHRNGPTGTVKMAFMKKFAKFGDLLELPGTGSMT